MFRKVIILASALTLCYLSHAQNLASIIQKHHKSHQQNYWDAIQSVSAKGNWHGDFGDHLANYYIKRPNKFLMVNQKERFIQSFDGRDAWTIAKWTKSKVVSLEKEQEMMLRQSVIFGSPINANSSGLELKGEVEVDGESCYWIVEEKENMHREYFISRQTHLMYKIITTDKSGEFDLTITTTIKKYRKLQGLIFPTIVDVKTKNFFSEYSYSEIVVGDIIDNKRFQRPKS